MTKTITNYSATPPVEVLDETLRNVENAINWAFSALVMLYGDDEPDEIGSALMDLQEAEIKVSNVRSYL